MVPAGPESQIHDTVVFAYGDYHLALFHAQHDARFLDVELAASRDVNTSCMSNMGGRLFRWARAEVGIGNRYCKHRRSPARDRLWLFYGGQSMPADLLARRRNQQRGVARRRR